MPIESVRLFGLACFHRAVISSTAELTVAVDTAQPNYDDG